MIVAGALTQLVGVACLILNLGSLPFARDLHAHTHSILAAIVAALATVICGTLVYRGRLVPIALAAGLDIGFGIGLPRGNAAIGTLLHVLPKDDVETANTLITAGAITMFVAAIMCVLAIPVALRLRAWKRAELEREALAARGAEGERAKRMSAAHVVPPIAANTLRGVGPKVLPTQMIRIGGPRGKRRVIIGVAVTLTVIGIVVMMAVSSSSTPGPGPGPAPATKGSGAAVVLVGSGGSAGSSAAVVEVVVDAAPALPQDPPVEEILARLHLALVHTKADELGLLFDEQVFAFGIEAHELAEGKAAVIALLQHDLGTPPAGGFEVSPRFTQSGHEADTGWIAEELKIGGKTYVTTAVVDLRDGVWSIAALQIALTMTNAEAYKAARTGELAVPDAIPDSHDDSPLAKAMRTGFASKPSFVAARSTRSDALNFGSAPGERVLGGDNIRKIFSKIKATIRLHDAVKVGPAGTHGGWGAANVDFSDADRDGTTVTQTFRVLVAWVEEAGGWRMVQSQWSNAR